MLKLPRIHEALFRQSATVWSTQGRHKFFTPVDQTRCLSKVLQVEQQAVRLMLTVDRVFPRQHRQMSTKPELLVDNREELNTDKQKYDSQSCHRLAQSKRKDAETSIIETGIKLTGWVTALRKHKSIAFINIVDGSSPNSIQLVCKFTDQSALDGVTIGSAVSAHGDLILKSKGKATIAESANDVGSFKPHDLELAVSSLKILSPLCTAGDKHSQGKYTLPADSCEPSFVSNQDASPIVGAMKEESKFPDLGLLRSKNGLLVRHRLAPFSAMLRTRARVKQYVHEVMRNLDYLETDTPLLTTSDCEGAGETFIVSSTRQGDDSSGSPLHLTVSGQLHLEMMVLGLGKVYTLSPTFRAEASHSRRHLAEFRMLEAEFLLDSVHHETGLDQHQMDAKRNDDSVDLLCAEIERVMRNIVERVTSLLDDDCTDNGAFLADAELVYRYLGDASYSSFKEYAKHRLACLIGTDSDKGLELPYQKITFHDACCLLDCGNLTTSTKQQWSQAAASERLVRGNLSRQDELSLIALLAEHGSSAGQTALPRPVFVTHFPARTKPFYCAVQGATDATDESQAVSLSVDLLVPEIGELVGGSVREDNETRLSRRLKQQSDSLDVEKSLEWYVNLRSTIPGHAPHAGFGLGLERFLMFLLGVANIRDVVTIPREVGKMFM